MQIDDKYKQARPVGVIINQFFASSKSVGSLGPVSRKSRELFGPEKPVVQLQSACFEKLVLQQVFTIIKTYRIAKFYG